MKKQPQSLLSLRESIFMDLVNTKKGIDVSHYQGKIDWKKVAAVTVPEEPIKFAYIKVSEGATVKDADAATYAAGALLHKIPIGYYHFANPERAAGDATAECDYFISLLKGLPSPNLPLPYVLDLERNSDGLSKTEYLAWVNEFRTRFASYYAGNLVIYGGPAFLDTNLPVTHKLGSLPLWVAHYGVAAPALPIGWADWILWQYTEAGTVNGIKGPVDLNFAKPPFTVLSHDRRLLDGGFDILVAESPVDPFPSPALCPVDGLGKDINAARFGCSRSSGTKWHGGLDLRADVGTEFVAIYSGKINAGGIRDLPETDPSYKKDVGNFIIVRSKDFSIKYCHLSKINVKVGDTITQGMTLGETGKSGNAFDVPYKHLHIEVSTNHFLDKSQYVDPEPYLKTKYTPANPNNADHTKCP